MIDANDVERVAAFWSGALGRPAERDDEGPYVVLRAPEGESVDVLVLEVPEGKVVKNRVHLDLSPLGVDQAEELARLRALGATALDIGQGSPSWIVLADPEGNEFCLLATRVDAHEAAAHEG